MWILIKHFEIVKVKEKVFENTSYNNREGERCVKEGRERTRRHREEREAKGGRAALRNVGKEQGEITPYSQTLLYFTSTISERLL